VGRRIGFKTREFFLTFFRFPLPNWFCLTAHSRDATCRVLFVRFVRLGPRFGRRFGEDCRPSEYPKWNSRLCVRSFLRNVHYRTVSSLTKPNTWV
jgi:hypothetical protein